jgi:hypothetical protein
LFGGTITVSDKRIMVCDVQQSRLWGYGTMAGKEEASSYVRGLSGTTTMNFEIKVASEASTCRVVFADVSMNHNYCPVETVKRLKGLECAATPLGATRITPS